MIGFAIYRLKVHGGTLGLSPMPGRTRHYHADWHHLMAWKPDMVLTMTTQAELDRKGAGTLGADLVRAGVQWRYLPIADFGVPSDMDWPQSRDAALAILSRGGRVLVHCFGGCGRSGMMALRLMIAAGEDADGALARLRQIRPCAVETDAQMAWALLG
ncbi:protein phosphatase [Yoonia sp.]|uniref:protein-tyrosine phosphatase family protein n=1 Tax=Yoonia sp. TaxID=2212373 RepID=UPI0023B37FA2